MTARENRPAADHDSDRYARILDIYGRVMSIVLMLFGLRQWAVIVGLASSPGGAFETMSVAWQFATMYLAVLDLVASVGMWMRVAWGNVLWICAGLSEIALHTVFISTFGSDLTVVLFHLFALAGFAALVLLARREKDAWPFKRQ